MAGALLGLTMIGTDTGVGKTWVTALIARQLRISGQKVGLYKPACSGSELRGPETRLWPDLLALADALGEAPSPELIDRICPQRFHAPVAPPVAALLEQRLVDEPLLYSGLEAWRSEVDLLLIEGVGGMLCPLSNQSTIADFAVRVGFPVLIVARLGLGTINHTLLTLEAAERRGLDVRGIVFNESEPGNNAEAAATNPLEVARRTSVPVLGVIRHGSTELVRFDRSHFAKPTAASMTAASGAAAATAAAPTSLSTLSTAQEDVDFARDLSQSQLHEGEKGITINWLQLLREKKSSGANDGL